jgi:hypothetical protein
LLKCFNGRSKNGLGILNGIPGGVTVVTDGWVFHYGYTINSTQLGKEVVDPEEKDNSEGPITSLGWPNCTRR